jgi:ubiquitin-conjugating enzyme E2 Z
MATFISKDTVTRLLKDVKQIIQNPLIDNGIYYIHNESDIMKGYALIIGPPDTPYYGGNYFFEISYPLDYPHSPPKVKYCTNGNNIRFNPNLYVCGKVCISLLNTWRGEQWTSCQSISTILLSLCTLLCKDPLLNEPGVHAEHQDMKNYNEIITYANLDIAVCDIVSKNNSVYNPFFENFYSFIKENFLKNYDKLVKLAETKNEEYKGENFNLRTGFYGMNVNINYTKLIDKLKESKLISEIM